MAVYVRNSNGDVIRQSKNLRVIREYSRDNAVKQVDLFREKDDRGTLVVQWANSSTCATDFASYSVMKEWVSRRRCFRGAKIIGERS